jgi:hypothetical protein
MDVGRRVKRAHSPIGNVLMLQHLSANRLKMEQAAKAETGREKEIIANEKAQVRPELLIQT